MNVESSELHEIYLMAGREADRRSVLLVALCERIEATTEALNRIAVAQESLCNQAEQEANSALWRKT